MIDSTTSLEALNDIVEGDQQISHLLKIEAIESRLDKISIREHDVLYARTMINYVKELYAVGQNEKARQIALEMYQLTFNSAFHEQHMLCCNVLGNLSARMGFYAHALDYYHQSLNLIDHHNMRRNYRSTLINNIASLYASLKLFDSAIKYYVEALKLGEQEGNTETIFLIYYNMGDIYSRSNQCDDLNAVKLLLKNMTVSTCQQTFHLGLYALIESKYERCIGNYETALKVLERIPSFLENEEDPITRIEYFVEKSYCKKAQEEFQSAFDDAEQAYQLVIESGEFEFERDVLSVLCELAKSLNELNVAIKYQEKLIETDEAFINRMNEMTIYQIQEKSALNIEEKLNNNTLKLLKNMQMIYDISKELTREQDYDNLFSLIIEKLLGFLKFDALVIGLYDSERKVIYNRMMYHKNEITKSFDVEISNKSSLAAWCIRHNQEIYTGFNSHLSIDDFEPLNANFPDLEVPYESVFYLPLYDDAKIVAVFSLQKFERDGFDHYELEMIRAISAYLSIAITNALKSREMKRLNIALEKISLTDSLSGLYNRYALNKDLKEYLENSEKYLKNIGAMMIDVDYFKEYNDIYGHLEGDRIIRNVAEIINRRIEGSNANAYRYGGDEFLVIFQGQSELKAKTIAQQILKDVEIERIRHENNSVSDYISLSIGLTIVDVFSLPISEDDLLKRADLALYTAKRRGRNQLAVYSEGQ